MTFEEALLDLASEIGVPAPARSAPLAPPPVDATNSLVALARGAQSAEPTIVRRGMVLPLAEFSDGSARFDLDSGIAAPVGALMRLVERASEDPNFLDDPDTIRDGLTAALPAVGGTARTFLPRRSPTGGPAVSAEAQPADDVAGQIAVLRDRARSLGVRRLPPSPPGASRDRILQELSEVVSHAESRIPPGPATSVPSSGGDGLRKLGEARLVREHLASNPHVQAIPGRQGLPTKVEQQRLANEFFNSGGQLPDPGPWGRALTSDVRGALSKQVSGRIDPVPLPRLRREDIPSLARAGQEPRGPRQFPLVRQQEAPDFSAVLKKNENDLQTLARAYLGEERKAGRLQGELSNLMDEVPILRQGAIDEDSIPTDSARIMHLRNILNRINGAD